MSNKNTHKEDLIVLKVADKADNNSYTLGSLYAALNKADGKPEGKPLNNRLTTTYVGVCYAYEKDR